jgi:uncharacterized repeat protein (TIGR01451 family)
MRNISFAKLKQRIRNGLVAALFIGAQVGAVTVPFLNASVAHATPVCVSDQQGANDQPGQKDLTRFCSDSVANSISWNWDELSVSGNGQSLDACALFDTNGNGFADRALCISTQDGDPFDKIAYTCNDSRPDRCAGANAGSVAASSCNVSVTATQPFAAGSDSPNDLTATCTPTAADTAGGSLIDVCSYPSGQPNSDPSDCVVYKKSTGKIEVKKDLVPDTDPGLFNLQVDGVTKAADQGDNGTTGEVVVDAGNHSVGETEGTNSSLSSYTSTISCKNLNGTGTVIASGNGSLLSNIPVADGSDIVCTITNTRQLGSITLIKNVVNNNGGLAGANDFGLSINGSSVTSGQKVTLSPGSYPINEAGLTGYSFVNITGTGCPATLGGSVTLTNGQNITCTITNDDIAPTLTLVKTVTNNNGGTATAADFQGKIDGNNVAWSTAIPLSAGNHTATEAALAGGAGYTASAWSGACAANGSITLSLGQNAVCNITNDDNAPSLTLNKIISNTHGGTATEANWLLTATGPTNLSGPGAAGSADVVSGPTFAAGTYTLSESGGLSGYSASAWTCTNNVTVANNQITLANGQTTVCSITNSDVAPIIVILKQVLNPYGTPLSPDSFLLTVDGTGVTSGAQNTQFNAGSHTVGETQQSGYSFTSFTGSNCSIVNGTMTAIGVIGGTTTCTVTNTAIQPKLIVVKHVINDNGGTKTAGNFTMTVSGNSQSVSNFAGSEAGTEIGLNEGSYSVDELADTGYAKSLSADCSGTITIGQTKTCTITNNDIAPKITVTKVVVNNDGGTLVVSDFPLFVGNVQVTSGVQNGFSAGTYTVSETGAAGYTGTISGDCGLDGSITMQVGGIYACTITNNDQPAKVTVNKVVVNDNGGTKTASDFTLKLNGSTVVNGVTNTLNANVAYTVSETGVTGYTQTSLVCKDKNTNATLTNPFTPSVGQEVVCTITNDDVAPTLKLVKTVVNNNGGTATTANFQGKISGTNVAWDTVITKTAGSYTASESVLAGGEGYSASSWGGDCAANGNITLNVGDVKTCTITNDDVAPIVTIIKNVLNPYGTPLAASAFPLFIDGAGVISGAQNTQFNAGSHTVTEVQQSGYEFTSFTGTNCSLNGDVMSALLAIGQITTCTITNTAIQPQLIIKKHVINDNSGTSSADDFTMTVSGNSQSVPNFPGDENGTTVGLNEGSYSVDELADAGYTKSFSGDCSGTISVGQVKTCTITNDDVAHPAINIVKNGPATAHEGDQVTYTFDVTNTGDTATLSSVTVVDTIAGNATYISGDTNNDGLLQNTETWHFSVQYVIPEDTNTVLNTGKACAYDPAQTKVCDTDDHTLTVLHPGINVVKSGPAQANPGDSITYTFTVTNTGDTPLSITEVSDSIAGNGSYVSGDTNNNDLLDLTETWTFTAGYNIPANQEGNVLNTVTVCAEDSLEGETCDTDNHTLVVLAKVIVTKYNDLNRNGVQDEGEPVLPGWEFTLNCVNLDIVQFLEVALDQNCQSKTQTTGQDGTTTFTDARPGQVYELSETIPENSNWNLSNIHCDGNDDERGLLTEENEYYIYGINPGETIHCSVGNYQDTGTVTVIKKLTPSTDQGKFNLQVNGVTYAANVGDGGTTSAIELVTGAVTASETAGTNTSLGDYEASYNCVDEEGTVISGTGSSLAFNLAKDQNVVCTFTNNKGEILGAVAPVLVNTGSNIMLTSIVSIALISTVAGLTIATRRRNPSITFIKK